MKNMKIAELSQDLRNLSNSEDFWQRINAELANYGVTSVFYGALPSLREVEINGITKSMIWKSNHPDDWFKTFGEDTFLDDELSITDLFYETLETGLASVSWHDPALYEVASAAQIKRIEAERDMGLDVGFTLSTMGFASNHLGAIGVSMGEISLKEFDRMWPDKQSEIFAVCGLLDTGMREQHLRAVVDLSPRQKEMLVWLAAGLMPAQISDRLKISEKTVGHHIEAAKKKLNARTRDHAVAKALLFNLIRP